MATAGEMIKVIADVLARPNATVTSYYAALRKAGMISTTGRGRSAQDLSPLDVARILIVMLSADNLQEAAAISHLIGSCTHKPWDEKSPSITFEHALSLIIAGRADYINGRPTQTHLILGDFVKNSFCAEVNSTRLDANIITKNGYLEFSTPNPSEEIISKIDNYKDVIYKIHYKNKGIICSRSITDIMIGRISEKMP